MRRSRWSLAEHAGKATPDLYLPRSRIGDQARLDAARVPEGTVFRTKPQLLQAMIKRAVAAGCRSPRSWRMRPMGGNGSLRGFLEEQGTAGSRQLGTPGTENSHQECSSNLTRSRKTKTGRYRLPDFWSSVLLRDSFPYNELYS